MGGLLVISLALENSPLKATLKLTAKAPENRPFDPKRKRSSSNHPFQGRAVSFRQGKRHFLVDHAFLPNLRSSIWNHHKNRISLRSHPHEPPERYPGPFTNSFWRNFFVVGVWGSLGYLPRLMWTKSVNIKPPIMAGQPNPPQNVPPARDSWPYEGKPMESMRDIYQHIPPIYGLFFVFVRAIMGLSYVAKNCFFFRPDFISHEPKLVATLPLNRGRAFINLFSLPSGSSANSNALRQPNTSIQNSALWTVQRSSKRVKGGG